MKTSKKHRKDMKCQLYFLVLWVAYVSTIAPRANINTMLSVCIYYPRRNNCTQHHIRARHWIQRLNSALQRLCLHWLHQLQVEV